MDPHLKTGGEAIEFKNKADGIHTINPQCPEVRFETFIYELLFTYILPFVLGF